jgi:hypothetical protein
MTKFFLALTIAITTLVGAFVFAAFTIQATRLVALRPASTTVATRETPVFLPRYVEPRKAGWRKSKLVEVANKIGLAENSPQRS